MKKLTKKQIIKVKAILFTVFAFYFAFGTELSDWLDLLFFSLFSVGALFHYYRWFKKK